MRKSLAKVLLKQAKKMKAMMISGAVAGFVIGAGSTLLGGGTSETAFWHAAFAALGGGWLARWCGGIWFACLTEILARQQREWQEAQNAAIEAQMRKRP